MQQEDHAMTPPSKEQYDRFIATKLEPYQRELRRRNFWLHFWGYGGAPLGWLLLYTEAYLIAGYIGGTYHPVKLFVLFATVHS